MRLWRVSTGAAMASRFIFAPWQSNLPKGWTLTFVMQGWVTAKDVERWRARLDGGSK